MRKWLSDSAIPRVTAAAALVLAATLAFCAGPRVPGAADRRMGGQT